MYKLSREEERGIVDGGRSHADLLFSTESSVAKQLPNAVPPLPYFVLSALQRDLSDIQAKIYDKVRVGKGINKILDYGWIVTSTTQFTLIMRSGM